MRRAERELGDRRLEGDPGTVWVSLSQHHHRQCVCQFMFVRVRLVTGTPEPDSLARSDIHGSTPMGAWRPSGTLS